MENCLILEGITSTYNSWVFNMEQFEEVYNQTENELPENSTELTLPSVQTGIARVFKINNNFSTHSELDLEFHIDGKRNTLIRSNVLSINPHFGTEIKYKNLIDFRFGLGDMSRETDFDNTEFISIQPNIGAWISF